MVTTSQVQPGSARRLASGWKHGSKLAIQCGASQEASSQSVFKFSFFLAYLQPGMAEEVSFLKQQLREKEEEIAALKKRLERLEKVWRSTARSFIQWKFHQYRKK